MDLIRESNELNFYLGETMGELMNIIPKYIPFASGKLRKSRRVEFLKDRKGFKYGRLIVGDTDKLVYAFRQEQEILFHLPGLKSFAIEGAKLRYRNMKEYPNRAWIREGGDEFQRNYNYGYSHKEELGAYQFRTAYGSKSLNELSNRRGFGFSGV